MAAVGGGAEAMFSSGCASCCYKQRQGWTQGGEATVMSIENMVIYNCKGEDQLSYVHVFLSKKMSVLRSTMIPGSQVSSNAHPPLRYSILSSSASALQ